MDPIVNDAFRYRYILLCVLCFALSSGVTYVVIDLSRLRREFIPEIGFVDFIDYPVSYEVRASLIRNESGNESRTGSGLVKDLMDVNISGIVYRLPGCRIYLSLPSPRHSRLSAVLS